MERTVLIHMCIPQERTTTNWRNKKREENDIYNIKQRDNNV